MAANPFLGAWQRRSIQFDAGPVETAQRVLWIQGQTHFGDVRSLPFAGQLTPARYRAMTWRQRFDAGLLGFAGNFTWIAESPKDGICTWQHTLALTPRLWPDSSRYHWLSDHEFLEQGSCLDDQGQSHRFEEHWQRIHSGPVQGWKLDQPDYRGQALVAGDWAVLIVTAPHAPQMTQPADSFAPFSATVWQRVNGTWRSQFGTADALAWDCPWTPEHLSAGGCDRPWQPWD